MNNNYDYEILIHLNDGEIIGLEEDSLFIEFVFNSMNNNDKVVRFMNIIIPKSNIKYIVCKEKK